MGTKLATLLLAFVPLLVHARPDRNAYLNHSVTSVSGLIAEIKHDPEVADRFMRHFGMSKNGVVAMFSKLHLARLDRDTPVSMFSVPEGGAIKSHRAVLRRGEFVFVDAHGKPVLKLKCGNPVVGGREQMELGFAPALVESPSVLRTLTSDVAAAPQPTDTFARILPPATLPDIAAPVVLKNPVLENITNNNMPNTPPSSAGDKGLAGLFVAAPLAAFVGVVSINKHHGNSPAPMPEPVSITLLALGAIGIAAGRRSRRS